MKTLYKNKIYPQPGSKVHFNCAPHTDTLKLLERSGKPLDVVFQADAAYILFGLNLYLPFPHDSVGFYWDSLFNRWFYLEGE